MNKIAKIPSAHDVARVAGVSQAAVSRAFTEGASISELTRNKVLQAATELGYRPNHLAKSLITGKSGIVGVVIGNPQNTFHLEVLDELSNRLLNSNRYPQVFTSRTDTKSDRIVEALLRFRIDALVLMSAHVSDELAGRLKEIGLPVIYFNRRAEPAKGFFSVTGANYAGAGKVAEHMLDRGYTRPAVIAASENSVTSKERENGFVDKVIERGLPRPPVVTGHHGPGAIPAVRELLSRSDRPDAIFCTSDYMAMAAIETARFEFGLQIGKDLGVAGFDNTVGGSWPTWDLTTYTQPLEVMVDYVMEIILSAETAVGSREIVVPGELIVRTSTSRTDDFTPRVLVAAKI